MPTDVGVAANPEFLREGTSIKDFFAPPFTRGGHRRRRNRVRNGGASTARSMLRFTITETKVAEMIKYASNCYHGVKVAFANEIGNLAKGLGVDSHLVMDLFAQDTKLNVSRAYLKPGFAFGGVVSSQGHSGCSCPRV